MRHRFWIKAVKSCAGEVWLVKGVTLSDGGSQKLKPRRGKAIHRVKVLCRAHIAQRFVQKASLTWLRILSDRQWSESEYGRDYHVILPLDWQTRDLCRAHKP